MTGLNLERDGIFLRGRTLWLSFIHDGKRERVSTGLTDSKENWQAARRKLDHVKRDISLGVFDWKAHFTGRESVDLLPWSEAVSRWLASRKQYLQATTFRTYEKDAEFVAKMFDAPVTSITRADIKSALAGLAGERTSGRIQNLKTVIKGVFEWAADAQIIATNPAVGISLSGLRTKDGRGPADPLEPEEIKRIIEACCAPDGPGKHLAATYRFACYSGLRISEMFALTYPVCLVAASSGDLEVSSAVVRGITKTTKTKLSKRKVSLIAPARDALLDVLRGQDPSHGRCLLSPATGEPWADDSEYRRAWIKVLEKAGVRYRNPYQTRHTFASMMLMAGEPEMWVASQMGHADWSMVRKVYGRWIPAAAQEAGQRGEEFISKLVEARA